MNCVGYVDTPTYRPFFFKFHAPRLSCLCLSTARPFPLPHRPLPFASPCSPVVPFFVLWPVVFLAPLACFCRSCSVHLIWLAAPLPSTAPCPSLLGRTRPSFSLLPSRLRSTTALLSPSAPSASQLSLLSFLGLQFWVRLRLRTVLVPGFLHMLPRHHVSTWSMTHMPLCVAYPRDLPLLQLSPPFPFPHSLSSALRVAAASPALFLCRGFCDCRYPRGLSSLSSLL